MSPEEYLLNIQSGNIAERALAIAYLYAVCDGSHHKQWVIDQMVRILAGDGYDEFVRMAKSGENGPETYEWNIGVAP